MVINFPYPKEETKSESIKPEERLKYSVEEAAINCEKAFSNLEKNLYPSKYLGEGYTFPDKLKKLAEDTLDADKSFSNLKYQIERANSSLDVLSYGKDIEDNLEKLKGKVSLYEKLESGIYRFGVNTGISLIVGTAIGLPVYFSSTIVAGVSLGIYFAVSCGVILAKLTSEREKNIITPFFERFHYSPIRNIVKYSQPFFYDLREKLKSNE
jgi:hypothetical protein